VRPLRRQGRFDGSASVSQNLRRPLHPPFGLRFLARLGIRAPVLHCQPAEERGGLPPRPYIGARPRPTLCDAGLRYRPAGRKALRMSAGAQTAPGAKAIKLAEEFAQAGVGPVLEQLDGELIGLAPVKLRIREIAALLLVDRVRSKFGLASQAPTLHM